MIAVIIGFNFAIILYVLVCHWIADFLFQNQWMYEEKRRDPNALMMHVCTYTLIVTTMLFWLIPSFTALTVFVLVVLVGHYVIDSISVIIVHKLEILGRFHTIYAIIGLDQILCLSLLFYTLVTLINTFPR